MCDSGDMGGVGMPFNTLTNTMGIGDVVAPQTNGYGSGDLFCNQIPDNKKKPYTKKGAKEYNAFKETSNSFDMSPRPLIVPIK